MAKFISKSANLNIILRQGLPAQPLIGVPAKAALSVRFQNGMVTVDDQDLVNLMINHPGFNRDFVSADDVVVDPFAYLRQEVEPTHVLTDLKHGTPGGRVVSSKKVTLPPEIAKLIQEQATEIAKKMLPDMVKNTLKALVKANEENKGVKGNNKKTVDKEDESDPNVQA